MIYFNKCVIYFPLHIVWEYAASVDKMLQEEEKWHSLGRHFIHVNIMHDHHTPICVIFAKDYKTMV